MLLVPKHMAKAILRTLIVGFDKLYQEYRSLILPCTHTDQDALEKGSDCGCGYLTYLRSDPGEYGFPWGRGDIVTRLLQSRAEGDEYEVLSGDRKLALGALVVRSEENALGEFVAPLPMITPMQKGRMYFVWHPQVAEIILDYVSGPMLKVMTELAGFYDIEPISFRRQLTHVTRRHIEVTYHKLALGKPIYQVLVKKDSFEVTLSPSL
jgi:hypothetical protein